jgi:hypothetical protein
MKKIIKILVMCMNLLIWTSCTISYNDEQKEEQKEFNNSKLVGKNRGYELYVTTFTDNGHHYRLYDLHRGRCSIGGFVHDPDCPCQKHD